MSNRAIKFHPGLLLFTSIACSIVLLASFLFVNIHQRWLVKDEREFAYNSQIDLVLPSARNFFLSVLSKRLYASSIFTTTDNGIDINSIPVKLLPYRYMREIGLSIGIIDIGSAWSLSLISPAKTDENFIARSITPDTTNKQPQLQSWLLTPDGNKDTHKESISSTWLDSLAKMMLSEKYTVTNNFEVTGPDKSRLLVFTGEAIYDRKPSKKMFNKRIPFVCIDKQSLGSLSQRIMVCGYKPVYVSLISEGLSPVILQQKGFSASAPGLTYTLLEQNLTSRSSKDFIAKTLTLDNDEHPQTIKFYCVSIPGEKWKVIFGYNYGEIITESEDLLDDLPDAILAMLYIITAGACILLLNAYLVNPLKKINERLHELRNLHFKNIRPREQNFLFNEFNFIDHYLRDIETSFSSMCKYLPEQIIELYIRSGEPAKPMLTQQSMTVIFIHTPVREDFLHNTQALNIIDEFFSGISNILQSWSVDYDIYFYDGICACWKNPADEQARKHNEHKVVKAAHDIARFINEYNQVLAKSNQPQIAPAIGIYSGDDLYYGNLGTDKRLTITIIGEGMGTLRKCCQHAQAFGMNIVCNDRVAQTVRETDVCRAVISREEDLAKPEYWEIRTCFFQETSIINHDLIFCGDFSKACELMVAGNFMQADKILQNLLVESPEDLQCKLCLEICERNKKGTSNMDEISRVLGQQI